VVPLVPVPVLALTVIMLVRARFREDRRQEYVLKPASTLLVIGVALLSFLTPGVRPTYTLWITLGLILSMGGDVALMLRTNRWFLIGLVLFLLAHVVYSITFAVFSGFHPQDLISAAVLLIVAMAVYLYLRPGLGSMKVPVILYMLVICFMVNRAVSTFFGTAFSMTQVWLIAAGAILFWLSDLMLAVNRFRRPSKWQAMGLFLYYGGQLLIALSPSYFL